MVAQNLTLVAKEVEADKMSLFGDELENTYVSEFSSEVLDIAETLDEAVFVASRFPEGSLGAQLEEVSSTFGNRFVYHNQKMMSLGAVLEEMIALLGNDFLHQSGDRLLFVDNNKGNDRNDGSLPDFKRECGPLASLGAAAELAQDGSLIIVFEGDGIYFESLPDVPKKKLTWLMLGNGMNGDEASVESALSENRVKLTTKRELALNKKRIEVFNAAQFIEEQSTN